MSCGTQLSGFLYKQPFGHQSTKWSKRFFVLKDGFMLYYADSEKKEFDKVKGFNIHPKGVVPLGGSDIECVSEPGHPYSILIRNSNYVTRPIIVAAESEVERDKWLEQLRQSARVTFENAELGDSMIRQLEAQGLQMAKEKQIYFDQLQNEVQALADEQSKTEELERLNLELEKEKAKMLLLTKDLTEQYKKVQSELDQTTANLAELEEAKKEFTEENTALHLNLQDLNKDKEETLKQLQQKQLEALKLSKENENLNEVMENLKEHLKTIEEKTTNIMIKKKKTEDLIEENKVVAESLLDEKQLISERVAELESSLKELSEQKAITESELKEEVMARLDAERRLREAEHSLARLERAVTRTTNTESEQAEAQQEMLGDVKTLKRFFETLAFEAKLDSEKSVLIKNSVHARKTLLRRVKTMRYEEKREQTKEKGSQYRDTLRRSIPLGCITAEEEGENNNEQGSRLKLAAVRNSRPSLRQSLHF